jgi:hypothetical protein
MLTGCVDSGNQRLGYAYRHYDYNRPNPAYDGHEAGRYYRDDPQYRERGIRRNDHVYRGNNGRYSCWPSDGMTSPIVGANAGLLGNIIAPSNSKTLGTALGRGRRCPGRAFNQPPGYAVSLKTRTKETS